MKAPYKVVNVDGLTPKKLQATMNKLSREGYRIIGAHECSWQDKHEWINYYRAKVLILEKIKIRK